MKTKLFNSLIKPLGAALAVALALAFASCGGGGGNNSPTAIAVTGVSLNKTALTLSIGAQETLTATVSPSNAANKAVTWNSSNASVTTVNGGVVTALSAGTATITVTTQDGGRTATCSVTVEQGAIAATGLSLNKNTMALTVGGSETLAPTLQPGNATNQNVAWASSNTNIATVSGSGAVTAASVGNATITATTQDGSHTAKCTVTVAAQSVPVSGLTLNKNTMTLAAGDATGTLVPAIAPINATNQNVTWTSSNTAVATVSARGIVTPLSVGNATITATAQGNRTAVCTVSVVSAPIQATAVQPNKYSMTLSTGNNEAFTATFVPANATNQNIVWTSSNTDIAVVSSSGVVTAIAAGTVTITAASDGGAAAFASPIATDNANNPNNGNIVRSGGASVFPAPLTVTVSPAPVPATGVTLDKNALALTVGSYETLIPTVYPANSTNQGVNWLSSNTSVAVVSSGGVVTAMSQGTAAITVATQDGGNMYSCTVTVSPAVTPVHPNNVILNRAALALQAGGTEVLTARVLPDNASNKNVYWASSNNAVAVVASNGLVTAIAQGTATITVATVDGGMTDTCAVTVSAGIGVTGVSLNKASMALTVGGTETLTATVQPANAANKTVAWASSNNAVAAVANGVVTGLAAGTATITVTTQDGGRTATCSVTVQPAAVADVYIAGYEYDEQNRYTAILWKNGVAQRLSDGTYNARALSVFVSGSDVYVAGYEYNAQGNSIATLWVNGVPQRLFGRAADWPSTEACQVLVSNGDVYVAGVDNPYGSGRIIPVVWKNGAPQYFGDGYSGMSNYPSFFVSGNDIYLVSIGRNTSLISVNGIPVLGYEITLLKNGVPQSIESIDGSQLSMNIGSLFVYGDDVYFVNCETHETHNSFGWFNTYTAALLWKNGAIQRLAGEGFYNYNAGAYSVFVSGGDVYVAGYEEDTQLYDIATLWINGVPQRLSDGGASSYAASVYVSGSDVYVAGREINAQGIYVATLWKNGVPQRMSDGINSVFSSVFVSGGSTGGAVSPSRILLNKTSLNLIQGGTETLAATVLPSNAANKALAWSSSNTAVATVTANGLVHALGAGTATITAAAQDGGVAATCSVAVTATAVPVTGVSLNKSGLTVTFSSYYYRELLQAAVQPANATNKELTWTSNNEDVVTVSSFGRITAGPDKPGTAVITATTKDGGYSASCTVTVQPVSVTGITLDRNELTVGVGSSASLRTYSQPSYPTNRNVIWSSSNTSVATLNPNGQLNSTNTIRPVAPGATVITATTEDGGYTASCVVTVTPTVTVPVMGITLDNTTMSLAAGGMGTLRPTVLPGNATDLYVTAYSSDPSVVIFPGVTAGQFTTVATGYRLAALKPGTAMVTVETRDGGYKASCMVTVTATGNPVSATGIILDKTTLSLKSGFQGALMATVLPSNATNKWMTAESSDPNVARISSYSTTNGFVFSIGTPSLSLSSSGTATITVRTLDGGYTASCVVTVTPYAMAPDVYVADGGQPEAGNGFAPLWKNGVPLSSIYPAARSIFMPGGDVLYAPGDGPNQQAAALKTTKPNASAVK